MARRQTIFVTAVTAVAIPGRAADVADVKVEWGVPECWADNGTSFFLCCQQDVIKNTGTDLVGNPFCFEPFGPLPDYATCCRRTDGLYLNHALLSGVPALDGCSNIIWDSFLAGNYLDGGGRGLRSSRFSAAVLVREFNEACIIGRLLIQYRFLVESPDGTEGHYPWSGTLFDSITTGLMALETPLAKFHLPEIVFFRLTSMTYSQMRYVLAGVPSWAAMPGGVRENTLPRMRIPGSALNLGCGGGLDVFLQNRFFDRIIAIDAVEENVRAAKELLAGLGRVEVEHSVVVPALTARRNATAPFFVDTGNFDWSSVGRAGGNDAPRHLRMVPTISCKQLLMRLPDVAYLKLDLEGSDVVCLSDLARGTVRPQLLSVELPCLATPCGCIQPGNYASRDSLNLLFFLRRLGYQRFKLVAQSPYNMRCWPNRCLETTLSYRSFTSAGLPGHMAVDVVSGTDWRSMDSVRASFNIMGALECKAKERFDLHASLT